MTAWTESGEILNKLVNEIFSDYNVDKQMTDSRGEVRASLQHASCG